MGKYKIVIHYDRDGAGGSQIEFIVEYPRLPSYKQWEEEAIGDELYWKVEAIDGLVYVRKSFVCAIIITMVKE